jgi:hypothetical protein
MTNKEFLQEHQLERSLPIPEARAFEKLLKEANESYVLVWRKEKGVKVGNLQYWDFHVHCPMNNFADAYAHVGLLWAKYVLPIWNKRHKKK